MVTTHAIKAVPREEWDLRTAGEIAEACGDDNSVGPDADAMEALTKMSRTGRARLLVVEGGDLLGIVALKDLMAFFRLKLDLEGGGQ